MKMMHVHKHFYRGRRVPEYVLQAGRVTALFTPIIGLENKDFILNNEHIDFKQLPFFATSILNIPGYSQIHSYTERHQIDLGSKRLAVLDDPYFKEKKLIRELNGFEKIILNIEAAYKENNIVVTFSAGLSLSSVQRLYNFMLSIIKENSESQCGIVLENPISGVNKIEFCEVNKYYIDNLETWYKKF